jgi:hypothetical protein
MNVVDIILVVCVIAGAVGFLVWNLTSRKAKPACHVVSGGQDASRPNDDVIVGASLARGLALAQKRQK